MNIVGFKAWLPDGSSVAADNFTDLPNGLVVVMAYYDQYFDTVNHYHYRKVLDGCDWYYFDKDDIHGVRSSTVKGEWKAAPEGIADELVKKSAPELETSAFNAIVDASMADLVYNGPNIRNRQR